MFCLFFEHLWTQMFHNLLFMQPGNSKCSSVYENCLEPSRALGRYNCLSAPAPLLIPFKSWSCVRPLLLNTSWKRQVYVTEHIILQLQASHTLRGPEWHTCIWKAHGSPSTTLLFYLMGCFTALTSWKPSLERYFAQNSREFCVKEDQGSRLMWKLMPVKSIRIRPKPLFLLGTGNKKKSEMWESQLGSHPAHTCQGIKYLIAVCDNWHWVQLFHNTNAGN